MKIGLHPRITKRIKSIVFERSFQVSVSESLPVTIGVPRGGVLSPIIFIVCTIKNMYLHWLVNSTLSAIQCSPVI